MSISYASGLSYYPNKGICGVPEIFDCEDELNRKVEELAVLIRESDHLVVHTGAGISTSVGIPDFRGPNGVWTLEKIGRKPEISIAFENAVPSLAHRGLVELERHDIIKFLITQNIDGLHLRSGFPRDRLAILHGDMFLDSCSACGTLFARSTPSKTIGLRPSSVRCSYIKASKRACRGKLRDTVLDWEDDLPNVDYNLAMEHSRKADLHVCIGSSLQMFPAAGLPLINCSKQSKWSSIDSCNTPSNKSLFSANSRLVIVNLQPTKLADRAILNIYAPADRVIEAVCRKLGIAVPSSSSLLNSDGNFSPIITLRSIHSDCEIPNPWRVLYHPTDVHRNLVIRDSGQPVNQLIQYVKKEDDIKFH